MNLISKLTSLSSLIAIVLFISLTQNANAQKVFATKSGQIYFNATGALVKIAAVNNQVDSKFVDATGQIIFGVLIKGFKFENQLMEDHFNENYMESTQFPKADFKGYIKGWCLSHSSGRDINHTWDSPKNHDQRKTDLITRQAYS
jgi:hypothetical protein